jgi:hypothetical protein
MKTMQEDMDKKYEQLAKKKVPDEVENCFKQQPVPHFVKDDNTT